MSPKATQKTHLTTRRGFVAALGFGGVSLYGLWAAYGAAPGPLALLGLGEPHGTGATHGEPTADQEVAGGHAGHDGAAAGPVAEEFRRLTEEFIERYRLADGTVHPRRLPETTPREHAGHGDHAATMSAAEVLDTSGDGPIDVLMVAGKWYYLPATLRLDAGQPYRFRMMALDVSHGASIQFGQGGRMARLRPGRLTEIEMTFRQAGRYFMYCTVYCGPAHDRMQASIEVV
jgi:plastocyanin